MQSLIQYRRIRREVEADLAQRHPPSTDAVESKTALPPQKTTTTPTTATTTLTAAATTIPTTAATTTATATTTTNNQTQAAAVQDSDSEAHLWKLPGITATRPSEHDGSVTFLVGWRSASDPSNPQNWPNVKRFFAALGACLLAFAVSVPSSIDAPVSLAFNEHFHVGPVAGSLTTGLYLIGTGLGALVAGTVSETFGRNVVYITTFVAFIAFILGKALAPSFGAALAFRFLTGFFGSTPLTASGGSVADLFTPLEMIFVIPVVGITAYAGPLTGPIIGAYLPGVGFRWADWTALIIAGAVLAYVLLCQPETYPAVLLEWRARHLRQLTGDARFRASEHHAAARTLARRLLVNLYRPFVMTYSEPIILVFALYLTVIYIVLFTFLNGYPFIFEQTYGISGSLTYVLWAALLAGDLLMAPLVPLIYGWAKKDAAAGTLTPEMCLWFSMLGGSVLLPASLWWMAWSCYPDVSIWVPLVGSVFFGYGLLTVFSTILLYTCFVYGLHSASALAFITCTRYVVSGAILPASVPMYENLGPHRALTIPAALATVMAPVPYLLYVYGARIRALSKNAMH
ncbi:c6 zinc finger domain-containing protein [Lasiosphaeria miniovina]|uniref:C6 zinc finger domain-containing protein n=1 Tax=Lasiosphaeria miniovina TaxID=1954250 RepID=A0AA40A6M8_9PEZI|nr:c6 zinc finger domain-containing protein [Lasiosphaeria miniovina]KAK0710200.1 c6 zinc finger domain-containing protein [Lasiosphaeria miniovina]